MNLIAKAKELLPECGSNVSHYIFLDDKGQFQTHLNDVCFARLTTQRGWGFDERKDPKQASGIVKARVLITQHKEKAVANYPEFKEDACEWMKFIIQESPYKDVFLNGKREKRYLEEGLSLNMKLTSTHVMSGITAVREGCEFPNNLRAWKFLVENGFTKMEAFILSAFLAKEHNKDHLTIQCNKGGHGVIPYTLICQDAKKLIKGEFNFKAGSQYPARKEMKGWRVNEFHWNKQHKDPSLYELIKKNATLVGKGWDAYLKVTIEDLPKIKELLK